MHGHLDYRQRPKRVTLAVVGSDGRADWDHYAGTLAVSRFAPGAGPVVQRWDYDRDAMFRELWQDLLGAIRTGTSPRTSLRDGIRAVRLVEAIERSMADDAAVTVAPALGGEARRDVSGSTPIPSFAERNGRNFGMDHSRPAGGRDTRQLFDLTGRRAIVTGGAGLLGRRFGAALVDLGAEVHLLDRDADAAAKAAGELTGPAGHRPWPATSPTRPTSNARWAASPPAAPSTCS